MATGSNIQPGRGMVLTNVTPGADFRTGEAEAWQAADRLIDKYAEATKPDMLRRARARGAAEGVEVAEGGEMPSRNLLFFGDAAQARTAALEESYRARVRTDIDAREAEIRQANRYDPEAYERAAQEMRSGFIQGAPPEFAVDVENYALGLTQRGLESVAQARTVRDEQEVVQSLSVRSAKLQEDLIAMAARGETESFAYLQTEAEYGALQDQREANPAILYSTDQRLLDDEKLSDAITLAAVNRDALQAYTDAGRGVAGYAAAARFIDDNLLNGEAFAGIAPGRLAKMQRDAMTELRAYTAADREEQRATDEAERQRRAERRERVGEYRLQVVLGEASEADIMADDSLDDSDKAALVRSVREQARREAREAAADNRAAGIENYRGLMDQAGAGTLTPSEIADARAAGLITPEQARTLRSYNDQSLRPIIDHVMGPVRDYRRRPGMDTRPDVNEKMAIAEEAATRFARDNPSANIEQRMAAGRAIAESVFGQPRRASGGAQQQATSTAQRIAAVNRDIAARAAAGRPYSMAEANRMRREAQHGAGD